MEHALTLLVVQEKVTTHSLQALKEPGQSLLLCGPMITSTVFSTWIGFLARAPVVRFSGLQKARMVAECHRL
jgi:hypothetical protein